MLARKGYYKPWTILLSSPISFTFFFCTFKKVIGSYLGNLGSFKALGHHSSLIYTPLGLPFQRPSFLFLCFGSLGAVLLFLFVLYLGVCLLQVVGSSEQCQFFSFFKWKFVLFLRFSNVPQAPKSGEP